MPDDATPTQGIGAAVLRKEDQRFITGRGRYTDDLKVAGQAHAAFVRSPHAHARIRGVDTAEAAAMPGVVGILTGADMAADKLGGLICGWMIHSKDGSPMKAPAHPSLAHDKVRYVGDAVAIVVADSQAQARAAAEAVVVDYEELPAVVATATARNSAVLVHDDVPHNLCYEWEIGDKAATEAAFAKADKVIALDLVNNRLVPNAMEPRAAIGEYEPGTDSFTLHTTSQNPHVARLVLSAFVGIAPEHKLRVVAPDVGGGFGSKIFIYAEETSCLWASKRLGRPVKWTSDRAEAFLTDCHGRDHVTHAELAVDKDGRFLGFRVKTIANMGAYLSTFASSVPTYLYGTLLAGQYATPAIYCEVDAVFTNTTPVDAYRGAGRPEATYLIERIVEVAARELNLDPAELRRRNFITVDQFPYQTPVALTYDTGDYFASLDKAQGIADVAGFAARKAKSAANGKLRGLGYSTYIEACGLAPSRVAGQLGAGVGLFESAQVRFNPTGNVQVFTGTHSHGQGHETTFAQVVASTLGVPVENVDVVHGDTAKVQYGLGTYGSRSLAVGGSALVKACEKIIAKGRKIVAYRMEAALEDIEFKDGVFRVAGTDKQMTMAEVAFAAYVPHNYPLEELEPGLDENAFYDPLNFTYPAGCHICEVEIDPDTGVVRIDRFTAVDDFGRIINPMIVHGQVHGGIAQGVGQALLEGAIYDQESGQLLTGSFMDYCMPRADDLPSYDLGFTETPCTHNPLGVKGCGEAGAIASPPAVINAITDAIGIRHLDMPATPERVWRAVQASRVAQAAE
ncbi:xanthine dehydrogenase family protein molybdopterin-binding subunit [Zavarzinia sp. CC-PAN008]|uniref:xanthine dehydrogenase family protein molybdopterin-binding subunit n=1 Tax=Zavarzinia sp. CC-PAN008 TaxID=3243332 RepID=UPI003F74AC82